MITPPKFIRDTLDTRDINCAKTRIRRDIRDSLDVSDIVGGRKSEKVKEMNSGLNRTVNGRRNTNPLCPEYLVKGKDDVLITIGEIQGNKPKVLVKMTTPPHDRSLNVKDIQGGCIPASVITETFRTPKLKIKDLINGSLSKFLLKPTSFSGANSPNSMDTGVSSISGFSLQSSPVSVSSKISQKTSTELKKTQLKKTQPNLPKSPSSNFNKKSSGRWKY
jgi:hypothetical protein